jgi:hypothetical protein
VSHWGAIQIPAAVILGMIRIQSMHIWLLYQAEIVMIIFSILNTVISLILFSPVEAGSDNGIRMLQFDGMEVKTTYRVDRKFIGRYSGSKSGYLLLNENGNGAYKYDYFVQSDTHCQSGSIELKWGFLVDEDGAIVRFERPYGYSYPIVYMSTGSISFQACTKSSMIDYLLVYKDGTITVSSSDDWIKGP